jgi:tetratricopeptide (TPR) repeat protein
LTHSRWLFAGWSVALGVSVGVRLWNALEGPHMWGYDAWGHVAYVLFLDLYRGLPWADQGWSYFHPPLHYVLGWLLAQARSGEVLMRGLSLLGSAASLGTAALAAWLARRATPERPALALLAFVAVACLPVHYFMSPMPGNQLTACFVTAATLSAFVANESRARPTLGGAAGVGVLAGLGLLTRFSGLLALGVVTVCLVLRTLLPGAWRETPRRAAARGALTAALALALAGPYYARNLAEFGTPFQLSRDFALVTSVEADQPPGVRTWSDYWSFPLAAFSDPNPLAPHLIRSVWASVYLNVWADTYRESDVARALEAESGERRSTTLMALLGLLPTALFALGSALALRDVMRGRRREVYVPLLVQTAASLAAFALFTWRVPIWSALKASYLFGLSLPFGLFLARGVEGRLAAAPGWRRALLPTALALVAAVASLVAVDGLVLPRRADAPATGAVHYYFGETERARAIYGRLAQGARYPVPWLDNLAAVDVAEGDFSAARRLYQRAVDLERVGGRDDPYRAGRLAVAMALDGDADAALALFDDVIARSARPELIANRGAVRAWAGDLRGAEADLRRSLEEEPVLLPAWLNLAAVLERQGRAEGAGAARERAREQAGHVPRGYPYGLGTGEVLEWGVARRGLLLLEDDELRLASPDFYRSAHACPARVAEPREDG